MNKRDFIKFLNSLKGQTINTLVQKKPFTLNRVWKDQIEITTSKNKFRAVPLTGTFQAYQDLVRKTVLSSNDINGIFTDRNVTYVSAILAKVTDVEYTTRPITLYLKKD